MYLQIELFPAYVDADVECDDAMGGETINVEDDSEPETKKDSSSSEKKEEDTKDEELPDGVLMTTKPAKSMCRNPMLHDKKWWHLQSTKDNDSSNFKCVRNVTLQFRMHHPFVNTYIFMFVCKIAINRGRS